MSSLVGRLRLHLGNAEGRLVNRLDRETSGVVLAAKSSAVARELGSLMSTGEVEKEYDAIVHGHVADGRIDIDAPLGRDERSQVAVKDCVRADGACARTSAVVSRRLWRHGSAFTWLNVRPATGRKHQIRIHLSHIGYPIVGDKIYGGDEHLYLRFVAGALTDEDREVLMTEHHLLHANRLSFVWRHRLWRWEALPDERWRDWDGAGG